VVPLHFWILGPIMTAQQDVSWDASAMDSRGPVRGRDIGSLDGNFTVGLDLTPRACAAEVVRDDGADDPSGWPIVERGAHAGQRISALSGTLRQSCSVWTPDSGATNGQDRSDGVSPAGRAESATSPCSLAGDVHSGPTKHIEFTSHRFNGGTAATSRRHRPNAHDA
jgi:hypothetical protein